MTVADLIARLRDYPGDAEVVTPEGTHNVPVQHTWMAAEYDETDDSSPTPVVVIL